MTFSLTTSTIKTISARRGYVQSVGAEFTGRTNSAKLDRKLYYMIMTECKEYTMKKYCLTVCFASAYEPGGQVIT